MIVINMAFVDRTGTFHPDAVWRLVAINLTADGVHIAAYGYHNQAALDAGADPLPGAIDAVDLPATTIQSYPDLQRAVELAAISLLVAKSNFFDTASNLPVPIPQRS